MDRVLAVARPALGPREPAPVLDAARAVVADERERLRDGRAARPVGELAAAVVARLDGFGVPWTGAAEGGRGRGAGSAARGRPRAAGAPAAAGGLTPVINATGVILHTNLGRATWAPAAVAAAARAAAGPSLLEMDAETGRRGRRARIAEDHLVALTGAGDALVTTNNAAALAVAAGLAGRRAVAVSRGELVEIGGGVRIPEIVRRAGARLVEVGTTNRTRAADFAEPLASGRVAMVLRVHPSNFRMDGFVESPDAAELAALAHAHGAVVVDDLGSGALLDTAAYGLAHEPTPAESLSDGADLVTFSGDKLLGGPQAGLVVGRADLFARLRRDPLARATRPDKTILAALAATLGLYRAGLAVREIPVWRAIAAPVDVLAARARALAAQVGDARVRADAMRATVGGGALPGETLPSAGLVVEAAGAGADALLAALRLGTPPVIARTADGAVLLDLRTVPAEADDALAGALARALPADPAHRPGLPRRAPGGPSA
ncbi:MAG: L-seryl-tRNA(Sec) selenium transferase [Chloroflexi bacterium]|nr:L-seryl-tRNA(Sec) selenium transferase [Chloroflexota bacterium]